MSTDEKIVILAIICLAATLAFAVIIIKSIQVLSGGREVPHEGKWGIYVYD